MLEQSFLNLYVLIYFLILGKDPLKKRLKEHWKVKKLVDAGLLDAKKNRNADYFCIVDFEATCEERNPAGYPHEIIEFPAVLVSSG